MVAFNDRRASIKAYHESPHTTGFAAKWYGGSGYSHPDESHMEHFSSISDAKEEFRNRRAGHSYSVPLRHNGDGQVFTPMGSEHSTGTPAVDEQAHMDLHPIKGDGTYDSDVYHRLEFGKRGGVKGQWS